MSEEKEIVMYTHQRGQQARPADLSDATRLFCACWGLTVANNTAKYNITQREQTRWKRWFQFILWMGCLALAACQAARSVPTLVPMLTSLPTPSITPSTVPTVARPTHTPLAPEFGAPRMVTLENNQSYDFRQETVGVPTEGDLYFIAFSSRQGAACFWANNDGQVGGRDLGVGSLATFLEQTLPRDRYSGQCVSIFQRHVYVYCIDGDPRLAVFYVTDMEADRVTFEFILHE